MKRLFLLALFPLLTGCIIVDDFGSAWDDAKGDICLNRIDLALYHQIHEREIAEETIEQVARGLTLDGAHYILLKKNPEDKGGFLFRFSVQEGVFTRYKLNPVMRKQFLVDYPDSDIDLSEDTVTVSDLGEHTQKILSIIAKDPRYWEEDDKTLYNPIHNPLCRFEDRDLKALEEADKPKN